MKFRETNLKRSLKHIFLKRNANIVVIESHLGLGDHLICQGLVREIARREPNKIFYFACLPRNYHSVTWMFQDLDNLFVFCVSSGREARQYSGFLNASIIYIGIKNVELQRFDEFFYEQHQIPFNLRWTNAKVFPGPHSENLYQQLNSGNDKYILVCDESSSGILNKELKIRNTLNLKVIKTFPASNNIYDWTTLILKATEIHSIDTSFLHLVESVLYDQQPMPLYYHKIRTTIGKFSRRLPWQEIEYS
jgi:hypothetical protein